MRTYEKIECYVIKVPFLHIQMRYPVIWRLNPIVCIIIHGFDDEDNFNKYLFNSLAFSLLLYF